ncbi:MAG TPA: flagellar biosynthetic protein FliO [Pirellulales bacterium]|jgi:flagellar biogenesis protein FliO
MNVRTSKRREIYCQRLAVFVVLGWVVLATSSLMAAPPADNVAPMSADPRRPVKQATHTATLPADRAFTSVPHPDAQRAQPAARPAQPPAEEKTRLSSEGDRRANLTAPRESKHLLSTIASLALVLGLFAVVVWAMRRGMPKTQQQRLPNEVVDVLGQATLGHRQHVQLLRLGGRLLLLSVTPNGAETLAEVTDSAEVERLTSLCRKSTARSAAPSFRDVFQQFRAPTSLPPGPLASTTTKTRSLGGTILKSAEGSDG